MEYKNMRMPELKSLARERRLRSYFRMRKTELVALLQNSPPPGQSRANTSPTPPTQTWEPIDCCKQTTLTIESYYLELMVF